MYNLQDNKIVNTKAKKITAGNSIFYGDIIFFTLFVSGFYYDVNISKQSFRTLSFYTKSLMVYYIFHECTIKQDIQHHIHHIIAIMNQGIYLYYMNYKTSEICMDMDFLHTMSIQYYMLITSVFSALRQLSKNSNWRLANFLEYLYFYIFVSVKTCGNIIMWTRWYNNKYYTIYLPCYLFQQYFLVLITALQTYFSYKILIKMCCKYKKNKNKINLNKTK